MTRAPTDDRRSVGIRLLASSGLTVLLLAAYVGTYAFSGTVERTTESSAILLDGQCVNFPAQSIRTFSQYWQTQVFAPAAYVEAKLARTEVVIRHDADDVFTAEP